MRFGVRVWDLSLAVYGKVLWNLRFGVHGLVLGFGDVKSLGFSAVCSAETRAA